MNTYYQFDSSEKYLLDPEFNFHVKDAVATEVAKYDWGEMEIKWH